MNKKFLIYWAMVILQLLAIAVAYHFGIFNMLLAGDVTMLSFVILTIHTLTTVVIGYMTYHTNKLYELKTVWFISEAQLSIGMVGTLVGFLILFSSVFVGIETTADIAAALTVIATGVGTALWTTLFGLISGLILKAMIVNLEHRKKQRNES
jgi:hypothetical protein